MTTTVQPPTAPGAISPPPPVDPELAAVLDMYAERLPSAILPEMITAVRSGMELLAIPGRRPLAGRRIRSFRTLDSGTRWGA